MIAQLHNSLMYSGLLTLEFSYTIMRIVIIRNLLYVYIEFFQAADCCADVTDVSLANGYTGSR